MLERIYIDNYKCLVNFEYRPGTMQLILGGNGSGKSTLFEVLALLRSLIADGATTAQLFTPSSLTRWQMKNEQAFELGVSGNGGRYLYKLAVEHRSTGPRLEMPINRVHREELLFDGQRLFFSEFGKAHLFRDDFSEGPEVVLDWERSGISMLSQRRDNARITWFKDWISRLYRIQINPYRMSPASTEEQSHPVSDLSNYASWYRHLSKGQPRVTFNLSEYLRRIISGFETFSLAKEGETTRLLKAEVLDGSGGPHKYNFDELSDGQRVIACLYTLLALMKEAQVILVIDEPDNFITLSEIQPWLIELQEQAERHQSQVLIISHHPEMINYLTPLDAVRFDRAPDGPARVAPFAGGGEEALPPSEIIARGWEGE
jgi:predicted ATPase